MNNFRFSSREALASLGGSASRYHHNLEALRILKACEAEKREATPSEQVSLSRYTGWGDTEVHKRAFPSGNAEQYAPDEQIAAILNQGERLSLEASVLNAHYTSLPIIASIYEALAHLGFSPIPNTPVRILEPAIGGSGNFIGMLPEEWAAHSRIYGVEIDPLSARIAKLLYPEAYIYNQAFEDIKLPYDYFDLIISNVPFSQVGVVDSSIKEKHLKSSLHDYFFVKAALLAKPNGLIAFITSRYTLDKQNTATRAWLARRTEFLGAIRLPETAFQANAGTQVITDVIFLRKRTAQEIASYTPTNDATWVNTQAESYGTYLQPIDINHHYITNPQYMLGTPSLGHGMYNNNSLRLKAKGEDVAKLATRQLIAQLPPSIWSYADSEEVELNAEIALDLTDPTEGLVKEVEINSAFNSALASVYHAAKKLIQAESQSETDEFIEGLRAELNTAYTAFFSTYGPINKLANQRKCDKTHPCMPLLLALEEKSGEAWVPAAIFTRRAVRGETLHTENLTPYEALILSYNKFARINLKFIAEQLKINPDDAFNALSEHVFRTPDNQVVSRSEYLSGNIREKIEEAERMLLVDATFQRNIDELRAVLPLPLPPGDVPIRLGSPWIPAPIIKQFIRHLIPAYSGDVNHLSMLSSWHVDTRNWPASDSIEAQSTWGTKRGNALWLIECGLNLRTPNIYDMVFDKPVLNQEETANAQAKLEEIKAAFLDWVWKDATRTEELCTIYNEKYNVYRERHYDGSHLTLPGLSTDITPRPHQKDAVWRALCSRSTSLGHVGGAGKTGTVVMTAYEMRRLGIAHRPVVAVPNHLPEQWAAEARKFYPGIKLYCPDKEALSRKERGTLLSRIATADYDLMIIPHTALKLLPIKPETEARFIEEELATLREFLQQTDAKNNRRSHKEIQRKIKAQENKLKELHQRIKRDSLSTISFEECGIDALFVDEAHEFKNLGFTTKATRIAGMNNTNSQRAYDLYLKTRILYEQRGRFISATATPVSNSLTEVFWNLRMHLPWRLKELGIEHFDDWAQTFCDSQQSIEMKPDGSGFRMNTRFSRVTGLPELSAIWREALDVRTIKLERPEIYGGKPYVVEIPASAALKKIIKSLAKRSENLRNVTPDVDNMLSITNDGRRAALDIRLFNPSLPPTPFSKIAYCAELVSQIHRKYEADKACQLIFCDLGTPKIHELKEDETLELQDDTEEEIQEELKNGSFYNALKQRLIKAGVPTSQIAFIHEAKTAKAKAELFAKMNDGSIRVMIGSTQKCGTGMNAQERLIAVHHLDTPWRPADIDQRNWRAQRPGNKYPDVYIFQYVVTNSFDAFSWSVLEQKSRYISQLMAGEITARTAENVDEVVLTAAQIKAIASGNPAIMEKVGIEAELAKLSRLYSAWLNDQHLFSRDARDIPEANRRHALRIELLRQAIKQRDESTSVFHLTENKKTTVYEFDDAENRLQLYAAMIAKEATQSGSARRLIGTYKGFHIIITSGKLMANARNLLDAVNIYLRAQFDEEEIELKCPSLNTFRHSIQGALSGIEEQIAYLQSRIATNDKKLQDIQAHSTISWPHTDRLRELEARLATLDAELTATEEPTKDENQQELIEEVEETETTPVEVSPELIFDLGIEPLTKDKAIAAIATIATSASRLQPKQAEPITPPALPPAAIPAQPPAFHQLSLFAERPAPPVKPQRIPKSQPNTQQLSLF